jgi:hypothetical protein
MTVIGATTTSNLAWCYPRDGVIVLPTEAHIGVRSGGTVAFFLPCQKSMRS